MALFIWNIELVVVAASLDGVGRLEPGLPASSGVLVISDVKHFLAHLKWSSISQLIKGKLRDLQKLLKYFNGSATFCV